MNRKVANLHIDLPDEDFEEEESQTHSPLIRFPSSARNLHQNNTCQETYLGNFTLGVRIKLMNVKKLEIQQSELLQSFEDLKESAISALIQKDEMIQSLREKCQNCQLFDNQEAFQQLETELKKQLKRIIDLEEERQWLKRRVEEDKYIYSSDLEDKDYTISLISQQIEKVQHVIQKIQIHHKQIQEDIKFQTARKNHLVTQISKVKQAFAHLQHPKSPSELTHQEILSDYGYKFISEKATSPTSSLSTSPNSRYFSSNKVPRTIQEKKYHKILSQRLEKQQDKRDNMIQRLSEYYGEKLDVLKFNICKNKLQIQYCQNKKNIQETIQEQSSHKISSKASQFSKLNRNRKQSLESYKSYLSSAKILSQEEERQPLSENFKQQISEQYPQIEDQLFVAQKTGNIQNCRQFDANSKKKVDACKNSKWNVGLCFMLGVITGGSIVILVNRLISN